MTFLNPFKRAKRDTEQHSNGAPPSRSRPPRRPSLSHSSFQQASKIPKQELAEDTIAAGRVQIERKSFLVSLKENPRGRFVRITEDSGGRHNSVIVPATGLEDFLRILSEIAETSAERGPAPSE